MIHQRPCDIVVMFHDETENAVGMVEVVKGGLLIAASRARAEDAASGDTLASMILISSDSHVASSERNLTEPV
jgi:hypothetical protein